MNISFMQLIQLSQPTLSTANIALARVFQAVKDSTDVEGLPTSAGTTALIGVCKPGHSYRITCQDAQAVVVSS